MENEARLCSDDDQLMANVEDDSKIMLGLK